MKRVTVLAPAKINLGLEVLHRRPDGYHEVATILQALRLTDRVDLTPSSRPGVRLQIRPAGLDLGPEEENLAVRAARLMPPGKGEAPGLDIELTKRIPVGAGLGGGSADGAAVLVGLNALRGNTRTRARLEELAAVLGSDMPFFIRGGTQFATGRGEKLHPAPPWPARPLVLVYPNRALSTRAVYEKATLTLTPGGPLSSIASSGFQPEFWSRQEMALRNDLEPAVTQLEPAVAGVLQEFRDLGCALVRVTGSGSAVFGVAADEEAAAAWVLRFRSIGCWSKQVRPARGGCTIR